MLCIAGKQFYEHKRRLDQLLRLRAFIEREQSRGTSLKEAREKLYHVYSVKAASPKQVKQWYDKFSRGGHSSSILGDYHYGLDCNHVNVQTGLRIIIKCPLPYKTASLLSRRAIQSRYLFLHDVFNASRVFIIDTFHGDIQYVLYLRLSRISNLYI